MKSKTKAQIVSALNHLEEDSTKPVLAFWIGEDGMPNTFISGNATSLVIALHQLMGTVIREGVLEGRTEAPETSRISLS